MKLVVRTAKCRGIGYAAWCPSLPGCVVRGLTKPQVRQKIQDAVAGYLSSLDVALPRELGTRLEMETAPLAS